ncbi:MAG: RagB/SusD family nutrient uptake outer membrane protein [Bacteroidetes bacterium]|nr:RagB/SusD family nutrient uptake outer membrane protein [Bacteroidota bacterium]
MKSPFKIGTALILFMLGATGCFKDLDTVPLDTDFQSASNVYKDPASYRKVLAKIYAGLAVSGQQGPAGDSDISDIDEGFGQYLRGFWYHQELTTDEAVIGWNDQTIKDFHAQAWTTSDAFTYAFYSRIFVQISVANEFIRETTEAKLTERGASDALKAEVRRYRAEARFLRALSYWHALDVFRNPPFAVEDAVVGQTPKQTTAAELFNYIESELKAIDGDLADPRTNEYARADKAAAWMLLAKLYLNAEVYIGQAKYNECLTYCDKILAAGYQLEPDYQKLFLADNHLSNEIIFPVAFDGVHTRTWGGMTFIIRAGVVGSMSPSASGVASGWGGTRTTKEFIAKFPTDLTGIKVDFNEGLTVKHPSLYVPGTYNNFDAPSAVRIADTSAFAPHEKLYEGHVYLPTANSEIQFTTVPSNSGPPRYGDNGADGVLETNGAKIVVPQAGLHFIKVNLNTKVYSIQKRDWAIVGTATNGISIPLQYDEALQQLYVDVPNLEIGSFRFVANNDASINFGDTGRDGLLETDGDAIDIDQSGSYKIYLDIDRPDYTYQIKLTSFDHRGLFYTEGQSLDIDDLTLATQGYAVQKFKNVTSTGLPGSDTDFPDTDFPMFRLADVYLMAAEAVLRGAAGGDKVKAAQYFNAVRTRAYTGTAGNYTPANLTLDVILDERGRELYWECHRRTDLVRFGQFTDGTYKWTWKGGVKEGASVPSYRNIFHIPTQDIGVNPGLQQNPGY